MKITKPLQKTITYRYEDFVITATFDRTRRTGEKDFYESVWEVVLNELVFNENGSVIFVDYLTTQYDELPDIHDLTICLSSHFASIMLGFAQYGKEKKP